MGEGELHMYVGEGELLIPAHALSYGLIISLRLSRTFSVSVKVQVSQVGQAQSLGQ